MSHRKIPLIGTVFIRENDSTAYLRLEGVAGPVWYFRADDNELRFHQLGWRIVDARTHAMLEDAFWSDQTQADAEMEQRFLDRELLIRIEQRKTEREASNDKHCGGRTP